MMILCLKGFKFCIYIFVNLYFMEYAAHVGNEQKP